MTTFTRDTAPEVNAYIDGCLEQAAVELLIAQRHLAAVEDSVSVEDLSFIRHLISVASERVAQLRKAVA